MDGLSLAANIFAVVDIAVKVGSICHEYLNSLREAKSDISRFLQQVQSYQSVLNNMQQLLQGPHGARLSASQDLKQTIEHSHLELVRIYDRLDRALNSSTRNKTISFFSSSTLKWPFEKKELDMVIANLDRQKQTISLALTIDHTKESIAISHKIDLSRLPAVRGARFDSHSNEHDPLCLPGTRTEILSSIASWIEDPQGHCIYWLRGLAGTGKSTISRTVALEFLKKQIAVGTFFFKKGEGDRARTAFLFTTIAHQLVHAIPGAAPFIQKAVEDNPQISDKVLSYQFQELILTPLSQVKTNPNPVRAIAIILDALDECDDQNHVTTLISLLSKAKEIRNVRLRFFITSRPELPIQLGFKNLGCEYENVALHEVPEQDIRRDIFTYFVSQLGEIRDKFNSEVSANAQLQENWPPKGLIAQLVNISIPLFIFASTVCRFIDDRDCGSPAIQASKFLSNYNDMDESSQMFKTYLPILNQMLVKRGDSGIQSRSTSEKTAIIERFRHIVGSMILLADPLSAESLSKILGVDLATVDMEFNKLRSVLNVPADPSEPVRLFHLSFRDFLVKGGNEVSHPFQVDEQKTHEALALRCLELLSRDNNLKEDICEIGRPGILKSDIEQSRINAFIPPYIRYACLYWVHHLKRSGSQISEGSPVHVFLTVYLLNWLEMLSLLDRISESISMIDDLMSMVENITGHQVSELLYDVKRVILSHRYIIDTAPLQLYSSVLLFSPQNSIVVKYYKHAIPEWIDLQPAVTKDWDPCLQTIETSQYLQAAIFSRDSSLMASASEDSVKIWRTNTGACIQELPIPNSDPFYPINPSFDPFSLSFSSDGGLLYLAISNGPLFAWRTDTWEYERQIPLIAAHRTKDSKRYPSHLSKPYPSLCQITFSNDARLVSFAFRQVLGFCEVDTGKFFKLFETGDEFQAMAYSHDMSLLLIGVTKQRGEEFLYATLWSIHDETQLQLFIEFTACAAFSQDSNLLAAKVDGALEIYKLYGNEYKRVNRRDCRTNYRHVVFSPDSRLLAATGHAEIHVFEVDSLRCIRRFRKPPGYISSISNCISFSHDSTLILAWQCFNLRLWDLNCNPSIEFCDNDDEYDRFDDAYFSTDFEYIMCRREKSCQILKAKTGVCLESTNAETFSFRHCPWAILADDHIKYWHRVEENGYRTLKLPDEICQIIERREELPLFLSQEFALLAAIMSDGSICVWESGTGVLILREKITERDILSANVEFSPGSSLIVLDSRKSNRHVTIWQASTGKILIDSKETKFIGFSPDSTLAIINRCYSNSEFLEILYTETGDVAYKLGKVHPLRDGKRYSFSQDCSILALSSYEFIEIWNLETKRLVQCVEFGKYIGIQFFTSDNLCLVTDVGVIHLGVDPNLLLDVDMAFAKYGALKAASHSARERTWSRQGLGFSLDLRWILWNEEKLLWIPVHHREEGDSIWSPSRFILRNEEGPSIIGCSIEKIPALIFKTS